jgi:hypothetical protein
MFSVKPIDFEPKYIDIRPPKRIRWACPYCRSQGWWIPSERTGPSPLYDHDKPNGDRCHKAVAAGKRKGIVFELKLK